MFIQIRWRYCAGFVLWLLSCGISSASAAEFCTLVTPETTLNVSNGIISMDQRIPVGGVIGETIISGSIDAYQCHIDPGKEIEFVLVGGMKEHSTRSAEGHTIYELPGGIGYSLGAVVVHPECSGSQHYVDGRDSPDSNPANQRLCIISSGMTDSQPYRVRVALTLYKLVSAPEIQVHHSGVYLGEIALRVGGQWVSRLYRIPEAKLYLSGLNFRQNSCVLDLPAGNGVNLETVSRTDFSGKGSVAAGSLRELIIAIQCSNLTYADISLTGNVFSVQNSPGTLKLERGNGRASGVGIRLMHKGRPVTFGESLSFDEVTDQRAVLRLQAAFVQTKENVEPGIAEGILNYTIRYQ